MICLTSSLGSYYLPDIDGDCNVKVVKAFDERQLFTLKDGFSCQSSDKLFKSRSSLLRVIPGRFSAKKDITYK